MAAVVRSAFSSLRLWSVRANGLLVLCAVALLAWALFPSAAPAADSDLTAVALKARKAVGLPAIGADAAVRAAADALLGGGDARAAFDSNGGAGSLVTASVPAGEALSTAEMESAVFDPRLTAIAVLRRNNTVAAAAALDFRRPFATPVLAGALVDPGKAGSLGVLFPPGVGTIPQISLTRYRGGELVTIEVAATAVPGREGAILVQLKGRDRITGPQIGYGLTYTLRIGKGISFRVQTRPLPAFLTSRPFAAGPGFAGADRQLFMKALGTLPPEGRKIIDIIKGAITVDVLTNSAPICRAQTSCAGFDPGNGYFLILNRGQLRSTLGRFIIDHELGHLADFLGLDTFAHVDFTRLFSHSPKWKNCFPTGGQCTPSIEVFADQFAFFSTNAHGVQSGYGDDRLATSAAFSRALQVQWAFRPPQDRNPLAGYGPLSKSFEDAMHSSADAL